MTANQKGGSGGNPTVDGYSDGVEKSIITWGVDLHKIARRYNAF